MAFTEEQEKKLLNMLAAYENGCQVGDLPDVPEEVSPEGLMVEVLNEGASQKLDLGRIAAPKKEEREPKVITVLGCAIGDPYDASRNLLFVVDKPDACILKYGDKLIRYWITNLGDGSGWFDENGNIIIGEGNQWNLGELVAPSDTTPYEETIIAGDLINEYYKWFITIDELGNRILYHFSEENRLLRTLDSNVIRLCSHTFPMYIPFTDYAEEWYGNSISIVDKHLLRVGSRVTLEGMDFFVTKVLYDYGLENGTWSKNDNARQVSGCEVVDADGVKHMLSFAHFWVDEHGNERTCFFGNNVVLRDYDFNGMDYFPVVWCDAASGLPFQEAILFSAAYSETHSYIWWDYCFTTRDPSPILFKKGQRIFCPELGDEFGHLIVDIAEFTEQWVPGADTGEDVDYDSYSVYSILLISAVHPESGARYDFNWFEIVNERYVCLSYFPDRYLHKNLDYGAPDSLLSPMCLTGGSVERLDRRGNVLCYISLSWQNTLSQLIRGLVSPSFNTFRDSTANADLPTELAAARRIWQCGSINSLHRATRSGYALELKKMGPVPISEDDCDYFNGTPMLFAAEFEIWSVQNPLNRKYCRLVFDSGNTIYEQHSVIPETLDD